MRSPKDGEKEREGFIVCENEEEEENVETRLLERHLWG
jgi:hypothetical protein